MTARAALAARSTQRGDRNIRGTTAAPCGFTVLGIPPSSALLPTDETGEVGPNALNAGSSRLSKGARGAKTRGTLGSTHLLFVAGAGHGCSGTYKELNRNNSEEKDEVFGRGELVIHSVTWVMVPVSVFDYCHFLPIKLIRCVCY